MMNRREWLRNAALLAAGVIAADQLELLDRLAPRSLFAAWPSPPKLWGDGIHDDTAALQWHIDHVDSPFIAPPGHDYLIAGTLHARTDTRMYGLSVRKNNPGVVIYCGPGVENAHITVTRLRATGPDVIGAHFDGALQKRLVYRGRS